jgi:4'-phosphopantetheinyl transferase
LFKFIILAGFISGKIMEQRYTSGILKTAYNVGSVLSWDLPPKDIVLGSNEVHIWRASLDLEASQIHLLGRILNADERARAKRFYFQKDRKQFIVARGLLRVILGRYLGIQPRQLRFCYGEKGKPALAREVDEDGLHFNSSHSNGLALYALTRNREVGVDLECIRPDVADEHIAGLFFSPQEFQELCSLHINKRREAFFNCWTRKEAYMKAKGNGLSLPMNQFEVSLIPEEPAVLLSTNEDPQEASRWSLQKLDPGLGFVGALAVEGHNMRVVCYHWPGL